MPVQDSCQGDSGGPLVFNPTDPAYVLNGTRAADRLAGLVSWGIGCGQEGVPALYANVAMMKDWVEWNVDAAKRPPGCPGAASATATFARVSSDLMWSGAPTQTRTLSAAEAPDADAAAASCQAACAARNTPSPGAAPAPGCAAFGVTSVTATRPRCTTNRATKARTCVYPVTYYCSVFSKAVPPRLCAAGEKAGLCARAAVGSWRLRYVYDESGAGGGGGTGGGGV